MTNYLVFFYVGIGLMIGAMATGVILFWSYDSLLEKLKDETNASRIPPTRGIDDREEAKSPA